MKQRNENLEVLPRVAIAILNYNGERFLPHSLFSFKKLKYSNYKIYLIDNGSNDSSLDYVQKFHPEVEIIAFPKNLGFSKAYNLAINRIEEEFVVFLNNDVKVTEDWLLEMVKPMLLNRKIAACGCKIISMRNPKEVLHAGGKITLIGSGMDLGYLSEDVEEEPDIPYSLVGFACGAALLVRKSAFLNVGGFDSTYFAYHEDVDLCWRFWLNGYLVVYTSRSRIYHYGSGSWGSRLSPIRVYLSERNRMLNILKNVELTLILPFIFSSFFYTIFRIFDFLKRRKYLCIFKMLKAYFFLISEVAYVLRARRNIQSRRVLSNKMLLKLGLIAGFKESLQEYLRIKKFL
jgi:hypothetical protein